MYALTYSFQTVTNVRVNETGMGMIAEEALNELEQLQVTELIMIGRNVDVVRNITKRGDMVQTLVQVFSLHEENCFLGVKEGI